MKQTNTKCTIFAKKCKNAQNGTYYKYTTTLTQKSTGERVFHNIVWLDSQPPKSENCPINIVAVMTSRRDKPYMKADGTTGVEHIFFIGEWHEDKQNPFVDTSMDDYE